jgi:NTE family protein
MKGESIMGSILRLGLIVLLLTGCSTQGVVANKPAVVTDSAQEYSIASFVESWREAENAVMLSFSGGGTRAAALSFGVMKEMRDTPVVMEGKKSRLLDDVHLISSVSGGSFTSAYYGLHGDGIFDDFEEVFLRRDVQGSLLKGLLNPFRWFSSVGRTEMAVNKYQKIMFDDATYADMRKYPAPLVLINASDLSTGVRFSFVQEYFDLLCSDLSTFPVARAVTASSAVPVAFEPIVVKNYPECGSKMPTWDKASMEAAAQNVELAELNKGISQYFDRDKVKYAHFVDGGITDNLGLRAIYEIVELKGGFSTFIKNRKRVPPRRLVIISVDASTDSDNKMGMSIDDPSIAETISGVSGVQLHRYNTSTIELMEVTLNRWAESVSTPEAPVEAYFILLSFSAIDDPQQLDYFNQIPTSFELTDEQVDRLVDVGGELLRNNPEFRRLIADLKSEETPH